MLLTCLTVAGSMDRHIALSAAISIVIRQQAELGLGGSVWDGALTLCFLLGHPSLQALLPSQSGWRGQRVLELGAGTGVCGIAAAALGATSVLLTDCLPCFSRLMRHNVAANGALLSGAVSVAEFEWGADIQPLLSSAAALSVEPDQPAAFDVLLASECVYDPRSFQPLLDTLDALTAVQPHTLLLLAYEKRKRSQQPYSLPQQPALPAAQSTADSL